VSGRFVYSFWTKFHFPDVPSSMKGFLILDRCIGSHSEANKIIPAVGAYRSLLPNRLPRQPGIREFGGSEDHTWWRLQAPA